MVGVGVGADSGVGEGGGGSVVVAVGEGNGVGVTVGSTVTLDVAMSVVDVTLACGVTPGVHDASAKLTNMSNICFKENRQPTVTLSISAYSGNGMPFVWTVGAARAGGVQFTGASQCNHSI
jgi:hypothetical protein